MTSEIITSLPQKYEAALKSGDLLFFPSTVAKCTESDIDVRQRDIINAYHYIIAAVRDTSLSRSENKTESTDPRRHQRARACAK